MERPKIGKGICQHMYVDLCHENMDKFIEFLKMCNWDDRATRLGNLLAAAKRHGRIPELPAQSIANICGDVYDQMDLSRNSVVDYRKLVLRLANEPYLLSKG